LNRRKQRERRGKIQNWRRRESVEGVQLVVEGLDAGEGLGEPGGGGAVLDEDGAIDDVSDFPAGDAGGVDGVAFDAGFAIDDGETGRDEGNGGHGEGAGFWKGNGDGRGGVEEGGVRLRGAGGGGRGGGGVGKEGELAGLDEAGDGGGDDGDDGEDEESRGGGGLFVTGVAGIRRELHGRRRGRGSGCGCGCGCGCGLLGCWLSCAC